ncbi:MAG TPA: S8 family serine peptidase [Acidimicrobiia bacterium]
MTAERPPPAWTRDSFAVRLPGAISLDDLSAEWAWGGSTGAGARVAVIDSGIDATHPALDGCVDADGSIAISIVEGQVVEVVGPHDDSFGHGTACAGIIHTLAPDARITSVKVLGAGLAGRAAAFLRGLGWAIEQRFDVVNLSLGTTRRDWALPFYELCDEAYFANVFVVTAANNMPRASFPSLFGSVTSVACNMTDDPWRFHYNPEPPTEFLARGIDVDVAWRGGGTVTATGNSYAAPHISGLAALIRAKHPELRPFQLKTVLWATAANVRDAFEPAGRLSRTMRRPTAALATGAALTPPRRSARG